MHLNAHANALSAHATNKMILNDWYLFFEAPLEWFDRLTTSGLRFLPARPELVEGNEHGKS